MLENSIRYLQGNASSNTAFDFIQESEYGVIAVVIQYRLGLFGESILTEFITDSEPGI